VDIEVLLRAVESRYRQALSAAVTAKARYLALLDDPRSTPASTQHARRRWEQLDARRHEIAMRMGDAEDPEHRMVLEPQPTHDSKLIP
jgi:hypothetical protein